MKSKVYFSSLITPENVVTMFNVLNVVLPGKVAVKVHSGEKGNQNFIKPSFFKKAVDAVNGTVVECNTAYGGQRNTTQKHLNLLKEHGWSTTFKVDLLDAEGQDLVLDIPNGKVLKQNFVGKNLANYDSMLVLSHFKGHPVGGFGGALKQLSIGCASSEGKSWIHSGGKTKDQSKCWKNHAEQNDFLQAMADSASSVVSFFAGRIAFVSVMCNLSVDCDCVSNAEKPCMNDIGILSSTDPVALDRACLDLIHNSKDPGRDSFLERVSSKNGEFIIDASYQLGFGNKEYELISV